MNGPEPHKIIAIFVPHQGCPHTCIFCNQRQITGQEDQPGGKDVSAQITAQLQTIDRTAGQRVEVAYYGGSFTGIPLAVQAELLAPAAAALRRGLIDGIRLSTRPDYIDTAILKFLQCYGVSTIELGVQSLDDHVLRLAERGHTAADVIAASHLIKTTGFQLGIQLMVGLPGQTEDSIAATVSQVLNLKPDFVRIYPVVVLAGTELERLVQAGIYQPPSLDETVRICGRMLRRFAAAGIPVIRLGLQSSEELNNGSIVAGPYHPAFRQLVEGSLYRMQMAEMLRELGDIPLRTAAFAVNDRELSAAIGLKHTNTDALQAQWGLQKLAIRGDAAVLRGSVRLTEVNGEPQLVERAVPGIIR